MPYWFYLIINMSVSLASIVTLIFLVVNFRRSTGINKSNYLLTLDKYFAENEGMQKIYKILSDNIKCSLLCDFEKTDSNHLSTYLTFLENFYMLITGGGLKTGELYSLFGHRIFSMLNNRKVQELEIDKFTMTTFLHCIKH